MIKAKVYGVIKWLALIAIAVIFVPCIYSYAHVDMQGAETVSFCPGRWVHFLLLPMTIAMLPLLSKGLQKIKEEWLFLVCMSVYLMIGIWIICNTSDILRADAGMVYQYALKFNEGDFSGFDPGKYLRHYPFQIGLITYERLLDRLFPGTRTLFAANLLWSATTNFILWRVIRRLSGDTLQRKWTILLSFLFLPHLFFVMFAYGQIPGLSAMMIALYMFVRFRQENRLRFAVAGSFAMALACQFKKNYTIGLIAGIIVFILWGLQESDRRAYAAAVMMIAVHVLMNRGVITYYEGQYGDSIGDGEPMVSFFAMGLQTATEYPEHPSENSGWENGYTFELFAKNGYDTESAAQEASVYLTNNRIPFLLKHPLYAGELFLNKARSTWTDPMFEAVWSGPQEAFDQNNRNILLVSLYRGGHVYIVLEVFQHVLLCILYGSLVWKLIGSAREKKILDDATYFVLLYFLGGFVYHLISETKSQYVFMYVYLMIPVAAGTISAFCGFTRRMS